MVIRGSMRTACVALILLCAVPLAHAEKDARVVAVEDAAADVPYKLRDDDNKYQDEAALANARKCLAAVQAARRAGVSDQQEIEMRVLYGQYENVRKDDKTDHYFVPMADVEKHCQTIASQIPARVLSRVLWETEKRHDGLTEADIDADMNAYEAALGVADVAANECVKAVDAAVQAGVADSVELKRRRGGTVTVGEAKTAICQPAADAVRDAHAAVQAKIDAELAPFRKLLKRDKLKVFNERFGANANARGVRGVLLEDPQDYAKATVWFATYGVDDAGCPDGSRWRTVRYAFDKKGKLKNKKEKSGCGAEPPASAYK